MTKKNKNTYYSFIKELKQNIINSRFQTASLANKQLLLLYLDVGKRLTDKIETEKWGARVLDQISDDLQSELPGLRGFSVTSLKKMRQFSSEYLNLLISPLATVQLESSISPLPTVQLKKNISVAKKNQKQSSKIKKLTVPESFFAITFTHHISLMGKCKELSERFFYMEYVASSYLSVTEMEAAIHGKYFKKTGKLPNNFKKTLPNNLPASALEIFRSDYFLDFMNEDDLKEEKQVESKMLQNIKQFILTMGKGFCFIGNQYRIEAAGKDNFVDLLFYNRILQSLIVIELKRGEFKPEHAGKLNFHLNVIDDKIKLPHENPTVGIILCRAKNDFMVEYSIKDINKAMGVATYNVTKKRPKQLAKVLPPSEKLIRFLEAKDE